VNTTLRPLVLDWFTVSRYLPRPAASPSPLALNDGTPVTRALGSVAGRDPDSSSPSTGWSGGLPSSYPV
jgi:hypothetical protein